LAPLLKNTSEGEYQIKKALNNVIASVIQRKTNNKSFQKYTIKK